MSKIKFFYIDKARYIAIEEQGKKIVLEVDYWNNKFKLTGESKIIEIFAKDLLLRKHRVNLVERITKK